MLLDLVQPFLRDEVGLEFAEISMRQWFQLLQPVGLGLFTASSPIVRS